MSWESWATTVLKTSTGIKAADHGGVYGLDGSCWGGTDTVAKGVPKDFIDNACKIMSEGPSAGKLVCNGKSYITVRAEDNVVCGKCGTAGVTVSKSGQAYVVGFYDDDSTQGSNNCVAVSDTADKLKQSGY